MSLPPTSKSTFFCTLLPFVLQLCFPGRQPSVWHTVSDISMLCASRKMSDLQSDEWHHSIQWITQNLIWTHFTFRNTVWHIVMTSETLSDFCDFVLVYSVLVQIKGAACENQSTAFCSFFILITEWQYFLLKPSFKHGK